MIGYCFCGSFCTIGRSIELLRALVLEGNELQPIMSETAYSTDTRFGNAADIRAKIEEICGRKIIATVKEAEVLGPASPLDMLVIAPCTGNTLAKLAAGITDSAATMAAKAQLRCDKPVVLALATNDGLGANLKNIGTMMTRKNIYFVPLAQDDPEKKPNSLVCDFSLLKLTMTKAFAGRQLQPVLTVKKP